MKYPFLICTVALLLFITSSCKKKNIKGKEISLRIHTIEIKKNGNINLYGIIPSAIWNPQNADSTFTQVYFCFSMSEIPSKTDHPLQASILGGYRHSGTFVATYPASCNFQPGTTYYFRAWGINRNGKVFSDVASIEFMNIDGDTCTLQPNSMYVGDGSSFGLPGSVFNLREKKSIILYSPSTRLDLQFKTTVKEGSYLTADSLVQDNDVHIVYYSSPQMSPVSEQIMKGYQVIVKHIIDDKYEITMCNAHIIQSTAFDISVRFYVRF